MHGSLTNQTATFLLSRGQYFVHDLTLFVIVQSFSVTLNNRSITLPLEKYLDYMFIMGRTIAGNMSLEREYD
jgi:hypothetical protein